jgi:type II secretory pathway pseudopilin PulG
MRGITSIELVFGVTIVGIILVYSMNSIAQFVNSARDVTEKTQALYLAEEGLELTRFMRDNNWTYVSAIPLNTTRYLATSTGATILVSTTPEVIGSFTRSFTVQNVYRNSNDDIVASTTGGSTADTGSKYVTMMVSWGTPTKSVSLTTILANIAP